MTEIPHGTFPVILDEFKDLIRDRARKLENAGFLIKGVTMNIKTARDIFQKYGEDDANVQFRAPVVLEDLWGFKVYPSPMIKEPTEFYFMVES